MAYVKGAVGAVVMAVVLYLGFHAYQDHRYLHELFYREAMRERQAQSQVPAVAAVVEAPTKDK